MPLQDKYERLPVEQIRVARDTRQRREVDTSGLIDSIKTHGVMQPVVVELRPDGEIWLVAGERRLASSIQLGLPDIPVRFSSDLSPTEREILELEENVKRSDLSWQEIVKTTERIHNLYLAQDSDWDAGDTAEACSINVSIVYRYLKVAKFMEDENISSAGTVNEAQNIILRRQRRKEGDALEELLSGFDEEEPEVPQPELALFPEQGQPKTLVLADGAEEQLIAPAQTFDRSAQIQAKVAPLPVLSEPILCADFVSWAEDYSGPKFNLIHCDFPYGVNLFSANGLRTGLQRSQMGQDQGETYDDSAETYQQLVVSLCTHLDKLLSISGHVMFWFSNKYEIEKWTRETFARLAPRVEWNRFPLIWVKSDNAGIAASPNYQPRHVYEACLVGSTGKRQIAKLKSDAYSAPTDKSIHVSAKPEVMLKHFMEMFVDENTNMLDPTCGSGTSLRAAEALGAKSVLGLEIDGRMVDMALRGLRNERLKRKMAGG